MAEVILMPRLSDTMTEGVIASWNKNVGDTVKKGDLLAEIETDKATLELESYQNGVLLHVGTGKGGKLQVNDLLAIIGKEGEDISSLLSGNNVEVAKTVEQEIKKAEPVVESTPVASSSSSVDYAAMEEVVLMPRLSDTMTEGVIASWNKNVGDTVKKGEVLADIETDKATMELESYKDGILLYQGAKAGEKIQVNDLLCIIGKDGLNIEEIVAGIKGGQSSNANVSSQNATVNAEATAVQQISNEHQTHKTQQENVEVVNTGRIFASPLAKKLAAEKGIECS